MPPVGPAEQEQAKGRIIETAFLRASGGQVLMNRVADTYGLAPGATREVLSGFVFTIQVIVAAAFLPTGFGNGAALTNGCAFRFLRRNLPPRDIIVPVKNNADLIVVGEPFLQGTLLSIRVTDFEGYELDETNGDSIAFVTQDNLSAYGLMRVHARYFKHVSPDLAPPPPP